MPTYKLFLLDGGQRVAGLPFVFDAESDRKAIDFARMYKHGKDDLELWEGLRHVTTLKRD